MSNPVHDEIMTWHGSPYDFDQFLEEKLGAGEGAQVYGHGVPYLTETKGIGEHYMRQNTAKRSPGPPPIPKVLLDGQHDIGQHVTDWLKKKNDWDNATYITEQIEKQGDGPYRNPIDGKTLSREGAQKLYERNIAKIDTAHRAIDKHEEMMDKAHGLTPRSMPQDQWEALTAVVNNAKVFGGSIPIAQIHKELMENNSGLNPGYVEALKDIQPIVNRLSFSMPQGTDQAPGRLYRVAFNANDSNLLDWDEPLHTQHPNVQSAVAKHVPTEKEVGGIIADQGPHTIKPDATGDQVYQELVRKYGSQQAASHALRDAGIHGIRYRDANSRQDEDPLLMVDGENPDPVKHGDDISKATNWARSWARTEKITSVPELIKDMQSRVYVHGNTEYGKGLKKTIATLKAHPDRFSFSKPRPSYNYVVFDPQLAQIREKYNMQGQQLPVAGGTGLRPVDHDPFEGTP